MVAVMASAEDMEPEERHVHQGCMAGFLHLFDRPQILNGRRLHAQRRLMSSSPSGSATPSERSMQLDRGAPSSPDMTPPAAPRPSLQLPSPSDLKDCGGSSSSSGFGAAPSWRLPRLSLDSRAVVDGRGKYRPREIRTPSSSAAAPASPSSDDRRSPSVVARLMGLDALPHGMQQQGPADAPCAGELRRSASERVPRGDHHPSSSHFRFVDPSFFERPSSPLPSNQQQPHQYSPSPAPSAAAEAAMRRAMDPAPGPRGVVHRRSRFDAREVFPEPAKRVAADPAVVAHGGEIALYGEIERRLRKRGIAEPARDLETLKQILEALQLKGLLRHHHNAPPPPAHATPPPIVVMRPSHRAPPQPHPQPSRRLRVDVDRARRPRLPDPSFAASSPARSPASPARRGGPHSPQRRVVSSPSQSPKLQQPFRKSSSSVDAAGARSRIARRAAQNSGLLFPDEEASTTLSDGGSSGGSFGASSRWDFDSPAAVLGDETSRKLERCGKLLSSIQAFTGVDASASDQQPSPVSVLDAASFLADEDSPSSSLSGSKRAIDFNVVRSPSSSKPGNITAATAALSASDPEDDEWASLGALWPVGSAADPDYAYVAELVRLFHRTRDPADDTYEVVEHRRLQQLPRHAEGDDGGDARCHRRLLCGAVAEALERQRCACPWDPASWLRGGELVDHVWAEVRRAREPVAGAVGEEEDLNDVTCNAIRRDLSSSADAGPWAASASRSTPGPEVADAVLQIERLVFKDLVADTIRELADADRLLPRRKLVF